MDNKIARDVKRIDEKLTKLINKPAKETWVRGFWIQEITGWDRVRLRIAREDGLIKTTGEKGSLRYLLESVPEQFIIKKETA